MGGCGCGRNCGHSSNNERFVVRYERTIGWLQPINMAAERTGQDNRNGSGTVSDAMEGLGLEVVAMVSSLREALQRQHYHRHQASSS